MKRLLVVLLLVGLVVVVGVPFSIQDLCYRPQDVMTTERLYDVATDTWIQHIPTNQVCDPLNYPGQVGVVYIRLQWR